MSHRGYPTHVYNGFLVLPGGLSLPRKPPSDSSNSGGGHGDRHAVPIPLTLPDVHSPDSAPSPLVFGAPLHPPERGFTWRPMSAG